jgi:hypothetical protein
MREHSHKKERDKVRITLPKTPTRKKSHEIGGYLSEKAMSWRVVALVEDFQQLDLYTKIAYMFCIFFFFFFFVHRIESLPKSRALGKLFSSFCMNIFWHYNDFISM